MRVLIVVLISVVTALTGLADASAQTVSGKAKGETYNGYYLDLSEIAGEEKYASMAAWLRQQLDIADKPRIKRARAQFLSHHTDYRGRSRLLRRHR